MTCSYMLEWNITRYQNERKGRKRRRDNVKRDMEMPRWICIQDRIIPTRVVFVYNISFILFSIKSIYFVSFVFPEITLQNQSIKVWVRYTISLDADFKSQIVIIVGMSSVLFFLLHLRTYRRTSTVSYLLRGCECCMAARKQGTAATCTFSYIWAWRKETKESW